ncbi:MAG: M56 family metallopeptidase, partial [Planctomycetota bacterium]
MDSIITFLNTTGKSFVGFSSSMLIQSSVLIILLLALDAILRKKVRVVFLYGIWMLILVKLVLPTTFSSPTGLVYWIGDKVPGFITETASIPEKIASIIQRIKPMSETISSGTEIFIWPLTGISPGSIADTSAEFTVEASPATTPVSWQGFAFLGWLTVVTAMLLLLIRRMFFVRGLLAKSMNPSDSMVDTLERCRKQMGVHRPIFLRLSRVAASPSVCGLFRPTILIPQNLLRKLKREELRSILLHEMAHIKRGDLWVSLFQTILQIVYFFNPLLWVANVIIRKVREQAVDEMVLVAMGEKAEDYPQSLLNISRMTFSRPALNLRLIGVSESKKALERRIIKMLNRPVPKSSKLGYLGLIAIVVIGAVILPMHYNEPIALAAPLNEGRSTGGTIVPGERVGQFTFDMTEDDVLERLGKPKAIFYGDQKYTLDNLPRKYFMHFGDVSFHIVDDSVKGITALSPDYKFTNGVRVGDSEQKIKKVFGNDFHIRESKWKDFLYYRDKGLMFEINKQDRTVMEINVSPIKSSKPHKKALGPDNIIIPGLRVGEYTFNMTKDHILESLGKPGVIFYGDNKYTLDDLPEKYYMPYEDISFLIVNGSVKGITALSPSYKLVNGSVKGITALSPSYKLTNGLRVGDSEKRIKQVLGDDFKIKETKWKDFLSYKDEGLMFEIHKQDRTVMEINVSPILGSEFYKKAKIPSTSHINEQGRIVTWKSVDFVREMKQFKVGQKYWKKQWKSKEEELHLKELIFLPNGRTTKRWRTWTKGLVFHSGDKTASKYTLKDIEGST